MILSHHQTASVLAMVVLLGSSNTSSVCALSSNTKPVVVNRVVPGLQNGMDYIKLGSSDLEVPKVCMGTMTFGEQNTLEEGVEQLNLAYDEYGINFLDTAEMYPVPTKAETQGKTDETVSKFLQGHNRNDIILATKVCGRSERMTWLRNDKSGGGGGGGGVIVNKQQIKESVDKSLQRLGTDYIDLLQIHWPDRYAGGLFGQDDFTPSQYDTEVGYVSFEEQLSALNDIVKEGKVRYIGLSNETPFGVCSMSEMAKYNPDLYPKIVSVQNSYSLLVRKDFEAGLGEACYHHNVGLLPYSPLASGILTGKYRDEVPEKARLNLFPGFMDRYRSSLNEEAANAYGDIAKEAGMSPSELALAWCYHREHVASTIIGATSIEQLNENIKAYDIKLDDDVQEKITKVYKKYTDPTKSYGA